MSHGPQLHSILIGSSQQIFKEKDYVNYRYFHKRACYLAYLAAGIQASNGLDLTIKFGLQNDNHLQPILLIGPNPGTLRRLIRGTLFAKTFIARGDVYQSSYQIRVILAAAGDLFPIMKTLPNRSCIRTKKADSSTYDSSTVATPLYNATLRSECSSLSYLKFLHQCSMSLDAFEDACLLGSVWLQKRCLTTSLRSGGFGQFEWACLVALLLQGGGLGGRPILFKDYNSYQVFKAVLQFLASTNLIAHPLIIHGEDLKLVNLQGPVLFDGTRGLNILFKMTTWSYHLVIALIGA